MSSEKNIEFLAVRFLRWFCPPGLCEGIEGDLMEQFEDDRKNGVRGAKMKLFFHVLTFFRPSIILRNKFSTDMINYAMFRSYFKISWRHLSKSKTFAAINVLGLAVGMAAALLIYEYVSFEQSFDNFHKNAGNIYRVTTIWNKDITPGDRRATTVPWSGPGVKEEFPDVLEYARFADVEHFTGYNSVSYNDTRIDEQEIFLADPGFIKIFSFRLLKGDPEKALDDPTSVIITESIANKYFKDENPLGKVLFIDTHENLTENNFKVTGVIEDPPANTHLTFDFLMSFNAIWKEWNNGSTYWHWDYTYAYLLLHPHANVKALAKKISDLRMAKFGSEMQHYSDKVDFELQPVSDIHLFSALKGETQINGDGRSVYFLIIVGFCIMISAYINYINLSTIKAFERRTEIGVRKVIGSTRNQLTAQLLVESFMLNIIAVIISFLIYRLSIPLIEYLFNIQWPAGDFTFLSSRFVLVVITIIALGIVLSALYPAFILTSFKPAEVLKGKGGTGEMGRGWSLRKSLIVMQFIFCIGFTVSAFALYRQLRHMKDHDLGMNIEKVIAIKGYGFEKYQADEKLKNLITLLPGIKSVGSSSAAPGDEIIELSLKPHIVLPEKPSESREVKLVMVDERYFETLDIKLTAGRNFDRAVKTDDEAVILNEAAAKSLGYDDPEKIVNGSVSGLKEQDSKVIGVIKNYHQRSLKNEVEPIVFLPLWRNDYGWNKQYMFVRLNPVLKMSDYQQQLAAIEKAWKQVKPEKPFRYFFLDSYFDHQYKADTAFSSLFLFFTSLAIFIVCLGLFGLVAYTTLQRTKEIGVRKVLGASVQNILSLLSKDFMKLILVAAVISVPLIALGLTLWLEQYAFRIALDAWLFIIPVLCIFTIALLTVTLKSLKVATANPVDSLRYE